AGLREDDADGSLGKQVAQRYDDVFLRPLLPVEFDALSFVVVSEAFVADPLNNLLPRDGHAETSCLARVNLSTSKGTSHRTSALAGGTIDGAAHPCLRRKFSNSPSRRRVVSKRAIASFAH